MLVMRGEENPQPEMFSYVNLESRVPKHHPIRKVRKIVDKALAELAPAFDEMYADVGRRSIPPEQLLRALLLQIFFSIRSERLLVERIDYDLLFRWFVGLGMDDPVWNHSTFSKNRHGRFRDCDLFRLFFEDVLARCIQEGLVGGAAFGVDASLIAARRTSSSRPTIWWISSARSSSTWSRPLQSARPRTRQRGT